MNDIQRDREERQHVIEVLKSWDGYFIGYTSDEVQEALRYAISSLKTDEAYQIMYEGGEIFTKDDVAAMLTEIQSEIREYHEIGCDEDCNNCRMVGCVEPVNVIKDLDIIQQKIDALNDN